MMIVAPRKESTEVVCSVIWIARVREPLKCDILKGVVAGFGALSAC